MSIITLTPDLIKQSLDYGESSKRDYESGYNSTAQSSHGMQHDAEGLGKARMAEVAGAIWAGHTAAILDWTRKPDKGWDFLYARRARVDVKHLDPWDDCLIWPINKNRDYDEKQFTVLLPVKQLAEPDDNKFRIEWWIDKLTFKRCHKTAGPGNRPRITPGTWFMELTDLRSIESLVAYRSLFS